MITKITNSNLDDYIQLFRSAEMILKEAGHEIAVGDISTLEIYFSRLKDIIDASKKDPKFIMLPLDEPHFAINTNTREIIIPDEFGKNGIAVAGDVIAENIFFEVDRYFDAQDLHNVSQIYIQWEAPGEKGQINRGISIPWCKDISNTNKLIFGWALTRDMVKYSGNMKISVMFADVVDMGKDVAPVINYALNTKPAQVKIFGSLDYMDHKANPSNPGSTIFDRLVNSDIGGIQANPPTFVVGDAEYNEYSIWATVADDGAVNHVITEDKPVYLRAAANPSNQSADGEPVSVQMPLITLTWKNKDGIIIGKPSYYNTALTNPGTYVHEGQEANLVLGLTLDKVPNNNKLYYNAEGNLYSTADLESIDFTTEAYEYYTYCAADKAGIYYVSGKSYLKYTAANGEKVQATSIEAAGPRWVFEEPNRETLDASQSLDDTSGRTFNDELTPALTIAIPTKDTTTVQQEQAVYKVKLYKATSIILKENIANKGVWKFDEVNTEDLLQNSILIATFDKNTEYSIREEGYYFAEVQKILNTVVVSDYTNIFWYTEQPAAPSFTLDPVIDAPVDITDLANGITVKVDSMNDKYSYRYEWYYRPSADKAYTQIPGAALSTYKPKAAGNYKAKVIVLYNDGSNYSETGDIIVYSLK